MDRKILAVLAILLITRLVMLDARPIDHDESIHAFLSFDLLKQGRYSYDPAYHGPFLYFSTASIFMIFGDSNFTSRLVPVIFSIIGALVSMKFRRWIGGGAYILTFFMIFSTSILYYSRYLRNDMIVLPSFLLIIYSYFRYLEVDGLKKDAFAYLAVLFATIMLCSKENSYIYLFILTSFIFLYGIYTQGSGYIREKLINWNLQKIRILIISSVIFIAIFSTLYTAGFSDMDGLRRATIGAVEHWVKMHEINDHAKQWWYYWLLLVKYEFLPFALAIIATPNFVKKLRKNDISRLELFSAYWVVTTLTIYQILSHKVPWLLVHLVAPLAFFSSILLKDDVIAWRKRAFRFALLFVAVIYLAFSLHINYIDYNDAKHEELIYIQIQPSAVHLANRILELHNSGMKGIIFEPENDYWPLPWYLRYIDIPYTSSPVNFRDYDFIVTSERNTARFNCTAERYELRPYYYMVLLENCR
ncbi:TIGR03663 family protein [Archaeoglobus sulfaticallidus PM70-1]|uniref:TIGR03663 family protein n=1 Tax=Archaeoglobus sulfaticallidus PM70-1 TaxID=387631 RepID=N0BA79_9EURY|nr:flippase activity-associated protein Agl23 [Archaeoglobus sulfaticallidus]AGK60494.1 TIGR03663 family protein [Archaeoglobus sulfaticallidus PM70-1]